MTLRDYFAAMALHAAVSNPVTSQAFAQSQFGEVEKQISKAAYKMADAMMKQRDE